MGNGNRHIRYIIFADVESGSIIGFHGTLIFTISLLNILANQARGGSASNINYRNQNEEFPALPGKSNIIITNEHLSLVRT